ncbi:Cof-type HAD-IIB family hydrolase [Lactobacillus hamsteri]|uniref:Cof-type HAD-IIB family hydrolase n=1 Tax=Lactobacillus hamsteri TaxID=96565 RepID=UPI00054D8697|nr:Cof-type HAD-IIB family hydrolase [Lactobacillus hamsteri]
MTIKAAFFDVDGTLFSHTSNSVPESTKCAFDEMHKNGIKIFTATGRHILELRRMPVKDLKFDGYVTLNGQIGLDKDQKIIFDNPIDEHDTKILAQAFADKKITVNMVEEDKIFINFINDDVKITLKRILSPLPDIGTYNGKKIYQCMTYGDGTLARQLIAKLPNCKLTQWNPLGFDIIPKDGSKMVGIEKMMKHFDLKEDEIIVFGDGDNDLEMLKHAGTSVAMGNGIEEVKKTADYVTDDIDKDGIYNALKHFNVI